MAQFMSRFKPEKWEVALQNKEKVYCNESPTLVGIDNDFGLIKTEQGNVMSITTFWIAYQILQIFKFSNCTDCGVAKNILPFAKILQPRMKNYKVTEIFLFFAQYAQGKYMREYTAFDLNHISYAFSIFQNESMNVKAQLEEQERQRKRDEVPTNGYKIYLERLKEQAAQGDKEAIERLKRHEENTNDINR